MFPIILIVLVLAALALGLPIATLIAVSRVEREQKANHDRLDGRLRSIEQRVLKLLGYSSGGPSEEKGVAKQRAETTAKEPELTQKPASAGETDRMAAEMRLRAEAAEKAKKASESVRKPIEEKVGVEKQKPILVAKVVVDAKEPAEEYAVAEEVPKTPSPIRPIERPRPSYTQPTPYQPSALEVRTKEVLGKIWNWIIVGEEFRSKKHSAEFAIATTWLIRVGALLFVFGIGFFLQLSIERGYLNEHARVALVTVSGLAMVGGGVFFLGGKKYDLFGQGLVGIGVSALYFAVYAAMQLFDSIELDQKVAFVLMMLVTSLSCAIAVRFNKLLIAMIGVLGGYLTPILLSTGVVNLIGLYSYLSILTAGVLAISYWRDWHLARGVSLFGTWGLALVALAEVWAEKDFVFAQVMPYMVGFFVMFSTMNFLYHLVKQKKSTLLELGMLWINAAAFFFVAYVLVMDTFGTSGKIHFHCKELAFVTLGMAVFYIGHIYYFLVKKVEDRVLLSSFFAIASFMLTITLPILISREWLSVSWAVQAMVMLWVAQKLDSRFLETVAGVLYAIVFFMFLGDLGYHFHGREFGGEAFWSDLIQRLVTFGTVVGSFFGASWLLSNKQKSIESLRVQGENNWETSIPASSLSIVISLGAAGLAFLYLNIEFFHTFNHLDQMLTAPAMTVLWVGLVAFLLVQYLRRESSAVLTVLAIASVALVVKLVIDLVGWEMGPGFVYPALDMMAKNVMIRFFDFGIVIGMLVAVARFLWSKDDENAYQLSILAIIGSVLLLLVYTTFELNSTLHYLDSGVQAGGISLLWSIYALAFIVIGLWKNVRPARYAGLASFAIVSAKVFVVDLQSVDEAYKGLACILLGIVMICGALVYMKCYQMFVTKEEDEGEEEENEMVQ